MKHWSIILRTALGGMSNIITKLSVNSIPLHYFLVLRFTGISLLTYFTSKSQVIEGFKAIKENKRFRYSLLLSAVLTSLTVVLFYWALTLLPIALVSILDNSFQLIFSVSISIFLGVQKQSLSFYFYFILLFPAMYLLSFKDLGFDFSLDILGITLLTINCFLVAVETHVTKRQVDVVPYQFNLFIKSIMSIITALVCIPIFDNKFQDLIEGFTIAVLLLLLYGVISSTLIKNLHLRALRSIGVAQTMIFTTLTPVFSIIFGMLIFQEFLTTTQWIGVGLIIISLCKLRE